VRSALRAQLGKADSSNCNRYGQEELTDSNCCFCKRIPRSRAARDLINLARDFPVRRRKVSFPQAREFRLFIAESGQYNRDNGEKFLERPDHRSR
jgi:hypothetical protein